MVESFPSVLTESTIWLGPDDVEKFSVSMGLDSLLRNSPYHHYETPLAAITVPS